jgi:hypothetical protein
MNYLKVGLTVAGGNSVSIRLINLRFWKPVQNKVGVMYTKALIWIFGNEEELQKTVDGSRHFKIFYIPGEKITEKAE